CYCFCFFFFSSRRRHTRSKRDWSSDCALPILAPPPGRNIFVISFIFFIILLLFSIWIIDRGIKPALMEIAERKTTEFATRAINAAVKFAENYTFEDIAETTTDHNGNVTI